jgi:hypothetical protein
VSAECDGAGVTVRSVTVRSVTVRSGGVTKRKECLKSREWSTKINSDGVERENVTERSDRVTERSAECGVGCQSDSRLYSEVVGKLWGGTKLIFRLETSYRNGQVYIPKGMGMNGVVTSNQRWSQT